MQQTTVERKLPFAAVFREPNKGDPKWYVEIPNINGVFSSGETLAEAKENIRIALRNHSQDKPLSIYEVIQMDSMEHMWNSGYQGYQVHILTEVVFVSEPV